MKKKQDIFSEYETDYNGEKIFVKVFKVKEKKGPSYGRPSVNYCPYCLSHLKLNEIGLAYCTGDKLIHWEKEFIRYEKLSDQDKAAYMGVISDESEFLTLFDRWKYCQISEPKEQFDCGYTNKLFFPIPTCSVIIPDPIKVANIEYRLNRKLTEQELLGESELWEFGGSILSFYKKGAKRIKIQLIRFPEDC